MTKTRLAFGGILAVLLLVLFGGAAVFSLRDSGPEELQLGERAEATIETAVPSTAPAATTAPPTSGAPNNAIEGSWTVSQDSVAGYRVVEDFAGGVSDFEAVGRTSEVAGDLVISGTTLTEASFEVQVASVTSDDSRRDEQFRLSIMRAGDYPQATFVLTDPIEIGAVPAEGETITVQATGALTLRDTTVQVAFPIEARLVGDQIETLGTVPVVFSDYGIANPSFTLVSVRDQGVVEFSLIFQRS